MEIYKNEFIPQLKEVWLKYTNPILASYGL